jgi:hypothetical protein
MLHVENIELVLNGKRILHDLNFEMRKGESAKMSNSGVTSVLSLVTDCRYPKLGYWGAVGATPTLQREVIMKYSLSVIHPKKGSVWGATRRNRFELLASRAKGAARFALSRPYANYRWQAHGEGRSFHQAPHPLHISRTPRGR